MALVFVISAPALSRRAGRHYPRSITRTGNLDIAEETIPAAPAVRVWKVPRGASATAPGESAMRSSFSLKGGGWYSDGYQSSSKPDKREAAGGCGKAECGTGACAGGGSALN